MDKNGDGSLTLAELKEGLADIKNGQEILDLMKAADTDNSGTINYTGKSIILLTLYQNSSQQLLKPRFTIEKRT